MPRTKEQMAQELAAGKTEQFLKDSTWTDLETAMAAQNQGQQTALLNQIINGNFQNVGQMLAGWLRADAEARAKVYVDARMADDVLTMTELDEVL